MAKEDWAQEGPFKLTMEFNPELFQAESIDEFLSQMGLLLEQIGNDSDQSIRSYTLVTPNSRALLPDPSLPLADGWPGPITTCFDRVAEKYPQRVAVSYRTEEVSYETLRLLTNGLARALRAKGIKSEDCVGIYGHRSPAVVVAILGILKAGASYCMMDPKYPADRINICLDIANIKGWIEIDAAGKPPVEVNTHLDAANLLYRCALPPTDSEHMGALFSEFDCTSPPPGVDIQKSDVAVITFTSGSTGLPKGVMGRHVPLTHFYDWMAERFGITSEDKFSMCSGIAHDPLQRDIFTPLYFGASIAIPTDDDIAEPGALAVWFKKHRITISCMTPAMGQLLTSDENCTFKLEEFRTAFFVGDMLIKKNVLQLRSLAPKLSVINMYGSTESQRSVGYLEVRPDSDQLEKAKEVIAVGVGMQGCQVLIINSAQQIAGVGEVAEIYVRSAHLAKGYVGLDEKTASVFLPNPFHAGGMEPGVDRMYRTGDLGRYTIDGSVECAGRADDQVKIRGFRIELGEINGFLSKHPFVKENVTLVREVNGQKEIVSFVVPSEKAKLGTSDKVDPIQVGRDLRDHLKEHLPVYMVPAAIVVIPSLPLTPNGKINRDALAAMEIQKTGGSRPQGDLQRVLTPMEQTLLKIWSKLLDVPHLSVFDNFYDVGGNSLLATRLTLDMRKSLDAEAAGHLQISMLLKHPTIEQISRNLEERIRGGAEAEVRLDLGAELKSVLNIALPGLVEPGLPAYSFQKPKTVFLTGGNGFLGAFILAELLATTDVQVVCGIRGATIEQAQHKLETQLRALKVWTDESSSRIEVVRADLEKPLLGMTEVSFRELSSRIDSIVHCGALVHWLLPYEKLKNANVDGTVEILRLAGMSKLKPVHHVSTTSVYDSPKHSAMALLLEDDELASDKSAGLEGGYPQSKWMAERVIMAARAQGIPTSIYRPGFVCGNSKSGLWTTDDFLCRLIKGCVQLKATPFLPSDSSYVPSVDMAPVDYVAGAIVRSVFTEGSLNKSHNVNNPSFYPFNEMFEKIRSFGYELKHIPYLEWRAALYQSMDDPTQEVNALTAIATQFSDTWIGGLGHPPYDQTNVRAAISQAPVIVCPDVDQVMFRYISYLIGCKFMQPPENEGEVQIDWAMISEGVAKLTRGGRAGGAN
jgi:L-aminoadipate-semialdehyde dehydrogenase